MLTAAQRKAITALHRKKEREVRRRFLVEGAKLVGEALASGWVVEQVVATEEWNAAGAGAVPVVRVTAADLARVSAMDEPNQALAVVRVPALEPSSGTVTGLTLALAGVQDPGNLGTILRVADWFGVRCVVCSPDCAERFNPKVVQASMGSIFRVSVAVRSLDGFLRELPADVEIAGACLRGENLYRTPCREPAVLVLGNESRGIPPEIEPLLRLRLRIPRAGRAESLNVATAAAVLCSEWRRAALAKKDEIIKLSKT